MLLAASTPVFLAGCATTDEQARLGNALATADAIRLAQSALADPAAPADCKKLERSGVRVGDRLDVALLKTDQALGRANSRVTRCWEWYQRTRAVK